MAKRGFVCPNCGSEYCSGIKFWKEDRNIDSFDLFQCHDCGQATDPGTLQELPSDWQPPRKYKKTKTAKGQVDLFGNIKDIRSVIDPVPKLVESPAGHIVGVYHVPDGSTEQYRREVMLMMSQINKSSSGRERPDWYKYRNIKRAKKNSPRKRTI